MGGLGVKNPVTTASHCYASSIRSTTLLVKFIVGYSPFELDSHIDTVGLAKDYDQAYLSDHFAAAMFDHLLPQLDCLQQRTVLRAKEFNLSGWLSVVPVEKDQFDLSAQPFRDALALGYRKPFLNLPGTCDGCGATFTVDHALDCRFGGLVTRRRSEVRDAVGDLASLVWNPVRREPVVKEAGDDEQGALVANLAICGVWQPQCEGNLDIRVVDTDALSYRAHAPQDILHISEMDKKHKYSQACQDRRASFTPICVSIDGLVLGKETDFFLHSLCEFLCAKWEQPFGSVMG